MTRLTLTSRLAASAALLAILGSCAAPINRSPAAAAPSGPTPYSTGVPGDEAGLQRWVANFRPRALSQGISPATYDRAMALAHYRPEIVALDRRQSEFTKPVWEYLDGAVSDSRITIGRQKSSQLSGTLAAIENRYGVDSEVVLAIWAMESNFGANRGSTQLIPALTTMAYDGRREEMFSNQLIAALKIIQAGDTDPAHLVGSWAGAMGHTQFMPTSFLEHAVDFNGDGRRDIWSNDPTDSLASTAAYLARNGWVRGMPWAVEVSLPAGFDFNQASRSITKPAAAWTAMGVRRANGAALPGVTGAILAPAGVRGPAFLITQNFNAIRSYNAADSYVMGVGVLSDRIAGRPGIQGAWPRSDTPLSNTQKEEIQRRLTALGFDTGGIDGRLGAQSVEAIKAFQRNRGLTPDGYANLDLLAVLRRG